MGFQVPRGLLWLSLRTPLGISSLAVPLSGLNVTIGISNEMSACRLEFSRPILGEDRRCRERLPAPILPATVEFRYRSLTSFAGRDRTRLICSVQLALCDEHHRSNCLQ